MNCPAMDHCAFMTSMSHADWLITSKFNLCWADIGDRIKWYAPYFHAAHTNNHLDVELNSFVIYNLFPEWDTTHTGEKPLVAFCVFFFFLFDNNDKGRYGERGSSGIWYLKPCKVQRRGKAEGESNIPDGSICCTQGSRCSVKRTMLFYLI